MDIKKTRRFETTDRAHADLFNIVIDQLNENDELLVKRAEEVDQKAKIYTDEHASRKDNPHRVTKEQLGLDQVDNIKQASKIEFDSHLNDNLRHIISQERDKWNNAQL
ncbi:MAG: acetyltransferase, partial [Bacillota bacterium]|nr:acetyltransferase [Bacillota bacterium]